MHFLYFVIIFLLDDGSALPCLCPRYVLWTDFWLLDGSCFRRLFQRPWPQPCQSCCRVGEDHPNIVRFQESFEETVAECWETSRHFADNDTDNFSFGNSSIFYIIVCICPKLIVVNIKSFPVWSPRGDRFLCGLTYTALTRTIACFNWFLKSAKEVIVGSV